MKLIPLMKLIGRVAAPTVIGRIPAGNRSIFAMTGGEFEGERLRGCGWPVVEGAPRSGG